MANSESVGLGTRETGLRWMFTLNNYLSVDEPKIWYNNGDSEISYMVYKPERAPLTNTPHLQGYLVLKPNPRNKNGRMKSWMIKNISSKCDWRVCRGSHQQCVDYVEKEETADGEIVVLGEYDDMAASASIVNAARGRQALKKAADDVKELIDSGATNQELWQKHFSYMNAHHKSMDTYRSTLVSNERSHITKLIVLTGPPGTGKSRKAKEFCDAMGGGFWLRKPKFGGSVWFDGYDPILHKVIVLDEFDGAWMTFEELCRLCDRYPLQVEGKGTMKQMLAEWVIVTSNRLPRDWYSLEAVPEARWGAMVRRMSGKLGCVRHMTLVVPDADPDGPDVAEQLDVIEKEIILSKMASSPPHEYEEDDGSAHSEDESEDAALREYEDHLASVAEYDEAAAQEYGKPEPCPCHLSGKLHNLRHCLEKERAAEGISTWVKPKVCDVAHGSEFPADSDGSEELHDGIDLADPDLVENWTNKRVKRTQAARSTPTTTLAVEKQRDKRWGKQPVQAKIALHKKRIIDLVDDDDDVDDK